MGRVFLIYNKIIIFFKLLFLLLLTPTDFFHQVAWTPDGKHIGAGSADRNVYVWDAATAKLAYLLPGHKGSVNEVAFHPAEPIVLSCSSDKKLFIGELAL